MKTADAQYKEGFYDELRAFRERVQTRAKQKVEDALKQYEEVTSIHCCCRTSEHYSGSLFAGRTTETLRSWWFRSDRSDGIVAEGKPSSDHSCVY